MQNNIIQFKRDNQQNSNKLHLDKYYTSPSLAKQLITRTYNIVGRDNISEIIEPGAGSGSFSKQIEGCIAYDIEPEGANIIQADFLQLDIPYKKGRLFIGNPPFGDRLNLARKFMKQHYKQGDYIAYILPISQLDNNYNFFEFNLIDSVDLGVLDYSNRQIHCCFNIYVRPKDGLNKRKDIYKLPSNLITIEELRKSNNIQQNRNYTNTPDFRICSWGAKAGDVLTPKEHYAKELGFYVDSSIKECFAEFIYKFNYKDMIGVANQTQTPNITIWRMKQHIINHFLIPKDLYDVNS